jgi:hypothetical protein
VRPKQVNRTLTFGQKENTKSVVLNSIYVFTNIFYCGVQVNFGGDFYSNLEIEKRKEIWPGGDSG